eukprot:TRINITY_DN2904_c0_g2_i1.p1 TRINITY_DN2904_c0_g2~~TRINITY_DN2904_c0_g2_i1.p1  ORF type:complete len:3969 (+),score=910.30 TRINITY_DN2904_c0_g2_i1:483-12389(+)
MKATTLFALIFLVNASFVLSASISSVTPRWGSVAGGTRLTIIGSGFSADQYLGNNIVTLADGTACTVISYYCTTTQVVCDTAPHAASQLLGVSVLVDNSFTTTCASGGDNCKFGYSWDYTPSVSLVTPLRSTSASMITVDGKTFAATLDELDHVLIGNVQCNLHGPVDDPLGMTVDGNGNGEFICQAGPQEGGLYNITFFIAGKGASTGQASAWQLDASTNLYQTEVKTVISSVTPDTGSVEGGTVLTLTGSGFSANVESTSVTVGDEPCDIVLLGNAASSGTPADNIEVGILKPLVSSGEENMESRGGRTQLICVTRAHNSSAHSGLYTGFRGIKQEIFWPITGNGVASLTASNAFATAAGAENIVDTFQVSVKSGTGQRLSTMFTAPTTSLYRFYVAASDSAELWIAADGNPSSKTKVAWCTSAVSLNSWSSQSSQTSVAISLSAGQVVYIETLAKRDGTYGGSTSDGFVQVGIKIHNTRFNNYQVSTALDEIEDLTITNQRVNEKQTISLTSEDTLGGSFSIRFQNRTTGSLSFDASASTVQSAVASLFKPACTVTDDGGPAYKIWSFEGSDNWGNRDNGVTPTKDTRTSYCGAASEFFKDGNGNGGSWGRAFESTSASYYLSDFPTMCMAYRLPASSKANMLVQVYNNEGSYSQNAFTRWRSITMNVPTAESYASIGTWNAIADGEWHYTCINVRNMVTSAYGAGTWQISAVILYQGGNTKLTGDLWIDEFAIVSRPRLIERVAPATYPNDVTGVTVSGGVVNSNTTIYNVTFSTFECSYNYSSFVVDVSALTGTNVAAIVETATPASLPLRGSLKLKFNNSTNVVALPATYDQMTLAIEQLGGVGQVSIDPYTYLQGSCALRKYRVTFQQAPGDLVGQFTVDAENATGLNPTAAVSIYQTGGFFVRPLPGLFLQTRLASPRVRVLTNGIEAQFASGVGQFDFSTDPSVNPTVTGLDNAPTSVTAGDTVTITGTGFDNPSGGDSARLLVKVGGVAALVTNFNPLVITIPAASAGNVDITVHNFDSGYATGVASVLYTASLSGFSPVQGGTAAGTPITITGTGFSTTVADNAVSVGGVACTVISASATQLVCTTGASSNNNSALVDVYITTNNGVVFLQAAGVFNYDITLTPTVASVSVTEGPNWGNTTLFVTGTLFGLGLDDNIVTINGSVCHVFSASATEIGCVTSKHTDEGTYDVNVIVNGRGAALTSATFRYVWHISNVSPNVGSTNGGTVLTIDGEGFQASNLVTIFFLKCKVQSVTWTRIVCITAAHDASFPAPIWIADGPVDKDNIATSAACVGTCTFAYSADSTPTLLGGVWPSVASSGDEIIIAATGINADWSLNVITIGTNTLCTITNVTGTNVTCSIGAATQAGVLSVKIATTGFGLGSGSASILLFPYITSVSPLSGSTAGGTRYTISGGGFGSAISQDTVTVGGAAATIVSTSDSEIVVLTPAHAATTTAFIINLRVDNIAGECRDDITNCTFGYSNALTPVVTSFTPTAGVAGTIVTLSGSGLTGATVSFGGIDVPVNGGASDTDLTATVPALSGGSYAIVVSVPVVGYASLPVPLFIFPLIVTGVNPASGSILGGQRVTISGSGFSSDNSKNAVTINNKAGVIVSSSATEIVFTTAANNAAVSSAVVLKINNYAATCQPASVCNYAYATSATPTVSSVTPSSGNSLQTVTLSGTALGASAGSNAIKFGSVSASVVSDSAASVVVTVPDLAAGVYAVSGSAPNGVISATGKTFTVSLSVSSFAPTTSSLGGIVGVTISGAGFSTTAGGNAVSFCGAVCAVTSATTTQLICNLGQLPDPQLDGNGQQACVASVSVNGYSAASSGSFVFDSALTSTVTAVNPNRGSTAGGTAITIQGTAFGAIQGSGFVTINGVQAVVTSWSDTQILATTGFSGTTAEARVQVTVGSNGVAATSATYFYVDLWSRRTTWGNGPLPIEGDSIVIPEGRHVLLDVSTPVLNLVVIYGNLIFDEVDLTFDAHYVMIIGGSFVVGTESKPFQHRAVITLHGDPRSREIPIYGAKVLALRWGYLDIHGIPKYPTWTRLAADGKIGDTVLTLQTDMTHSNWQVGDTVIITPSSRYKEHVEEAVILAINGSQLTLDHALEREHWGTFEQFDGVDTDRRAEVAVLSHNVVIQGDTQSAQTLYGATILISQAGSGKGIARVSGVEFRRGGQAFRLARYPIHWHMHKDGTGSYVRGCSMHNTYNRACTVHGTHNVHVEWNVAYNVMGHTFFIEDGIEQNNTLQYNLASMTVPSYFNLNTDQTPASFWVTNPANYWRHNVAAGSDHYGFWFRLLDNPDGPSATTTVCPNKMKLGAFENNTMHSNGRYGFRIFPYYYPREVMCSASPSVFADFKNGTSYLNMLNGATLGEEVTSVRMINWVMVDNGQAGIEVQGPVEVGGAIWIYNATLCGKSHKAWNETQGQMGLWTGKHHGTHSRGITFINFVVDDGFSAAIHGCAHCKPMQSGFEMDYAGVKYINVTQFTHYVWKHETVHKDLDGSLTGIVGGSFLPTFGLLEPAYCWTYPGLSVARSVPGSVCNAHYNFHRVNVFRIQPGDALNFRDIVLVRNGLRDNVPWAHYNNDGWAFLIMANTETTFSWARWVDPTFMHVEMNRLLASEFVDVQVNFLQTYDHFNLAPELRPATNRTWFDSGLDKRNNIYWQNNTQRWFDNANGFSGMATNVHFRVQSTAWVVTSDLTARPCPESGCALPPPPPLSVANNTVRWSDATIWPQGRLPRAGENATVDATWDLLLDIDTPVLNFVTVNGILRFDPKQDITLSAYYVWVDGPGQMLAGNESNPHPKNAKIVLYGTHQTPDFRITNSIIPGSKVLAVHGLLRLFGAVPNFTFTKLIADVAAGATSITVADLVDWKVNDTIGIAPTGYNTWRAEKRVIAAINGNTISFAQPLAFGHSGSTFNYNGKTLDTRAEVLKLNRNIVITGADAETQLFGGHIYVSPYLRKYDNGGQRIFRGVAQVSGVEFANCAQDGLHQAAIRFYGLGNATDDNSYVVGSAFHDGYESQLRIEQTGGILFQNNVGYRTYRRMFEVMSTTYNMETYPPNIINGNVGVFSMFFTTGDSHDSGKDIGVFYIEDGNILTNNIAAGADRIGIVLAGDNCDPNTVWTSYINNNVAHSALMGVNLQQGGRVCTALSGMTAWRNWDFGIFSYPIGNVSITNALVADNKRGILLNSGSPFEDDIHYSWNVAVNLKDITLIGQSPNYDCNDAQPRSLWDGISYTADKPNIGLIASTFAVCSVFGPPHLWEEVRCYPQPNGVAFVDGLTLGGWGLDTCGRRSAALVNNDMSPDASPPVRFKRVNILSTVESSSLVYFYPPKAEWIALKHCVNMDCDGAKHILFKDIDGSLTGVVGGSIQSRSDYNVELLSTLIPPQTRTLSNGVVTDFAGAGFSNWGDRRQPPGTCALNGFWNGYQCAGQNFEQVIIESLDADSLDRRVSPVALHSGGYLDLLNGPRYDQMPFFGENSQARPSTFFGLVSTGNEYKVEMMGTNPQRLRLQLPYSAPATGIRMGIWYSNSQRLEVSYTGLIVPPFIANKPALTDMSGSNYYDHSTGTLWLTLRGDKPVTIITRFLVQVSLTLDTDLTSFFQENFINNIAFVLNIDRSRIRVVDIRPGSVIVNFQILNDPLLEAYNDDVANGGTPSLPSVPSLSTLAAALASSATSSNGAPSALATSLGVGVLALSYTLPPATASSGSGGSTTPPTPVIVIAPTTAPTTPTAVNVPLAIGVSAGICAIVIGVIIAVLLVQRRRKAALTLRPLADDIELDEARPRLLLDLQSVQDEGSVRRRVEVEITPTAKYGQMDESINSDHSDVSEGLTPRTSPRPESACSDRTSTPLPNVPENAERVDDFAQADDSPVEPLSLDESRRVSTISIGGFSSSPLRPRQRGSLSSPASDDALLGSELRRPSIVPPAMPALPAVAPLLSRARPSRGSIAMYDRETGWKVDS